MLAPASSTTSAASCVDAGGAPASCQFRYFGGPVISNVKVLAVLWGEGVDAETVAKIPDFLSSLSNDDWMDWLDEYDTDLVVEAGRLTGLPGTGQVIGRGTFAGVTPITPSAQGPDLVDAEIGAELRRQIAAGALPAPDADTVYALFFPPGLSIENPSGKRTCQELCGFHGTAASDAGAGPDLPYLVIPDHRAPDSIHGGGCDFGCGMLGPFANLCVTTSHELAEAVTNPAVGRAPTNDAPLAWYDEVNGELGDVCSGVSMLAVPDGGSFAVQHIYSRRSGVCQSARQFTGNEQEFKIWLPSNRATATTGGVLDVAVASATVHGDPQPLALSVPGLPVGVAADWPATITSGDRFTLRLAVAADAGALTDAVVRLVATGSTRHSASLLLQVIGDFALDVSPRRGTAVPGGSSATYAIRVSPLGPPTLVSLRASGLPAGVTATFAASSVRSGEQTTLTVTAAPSASATTAILTITGTAGETSHSAEVSVGIAPATGCTASPGPAVPGTAVLSWLAWRVRGRPRRAARR